MIISVKSAGHKACQNVGIFSDTVSPKWLSLFSFTGEYLMSVKSAFVQGHAGILKVKISVSDKQHSVELK